VILTPLLLLIIGLMFAAARLYLARETVTDAARTAVEAAVVAPDAQAAVSAAEVNVSETLGADNAGCASAGALVGTGAFVPGGSVSVTVTCHEALTRLAYLPLHGTFTIKARAEAAIEPYRQMAP
jgi:Flp pilus assembly protein TadG